MKSLLDLTIAIPVKNEAANLPMCLEAIGKSLANKIVVIDSSSTDNTKSIASSFGAEVLEFKWNGKFPKKRNWYLRNHTPETNWVLFLDADECITNEFKKELRHRLLQNEDKVGYWLNYTTYFLGKQLKGGYPLRKLALFKVEAGEYERVDEEQWSHLDMEVHEHPVLKGKVGVIRSKIDHQDLRGVSNFVIKHNEYASWEAMRYLRIVRNNAENTCTLHQRLKYRFMNSILFPPTFFCGCFFLYGGFKDGVRGFAHAFFRMSYYMHAY